MAITVTPLHPTIGAQVRGIDLSRPLPPGVFAEIEAAFNRHAVLVFPGQPLTDDQQIAFSVNFGPLEVNPNYAGERMRLANLKIADISNLDADGEILALDSKRRVFNLGNQLWHTDSSFKFVPARCSLLSAREIPPEGGETEFADLRAAYDALPEERKRQIEGLVVEHSIFRSRSQIGFGDFNPEIENELPPVPQVLVRRHPGSGRKTLYIAAHASHIVGMPVPDGRLLLMELIEHATQRQFVHAHRWQEGDLVIWDNRCTMHRARPFDTTQVRDLRRVTTRDVASTLEQPA